MNPMGFVCPSVSPWAWQTCSVRGLGILRGGGPISPTKEKIVQRKRGPKKKGTNHRNKELARNVVPTNFTGSCYVH